MGQTDQPSLFEIESDKPLNRPDCLIEARHRLLGPLPKFYRDIAEMVLKGTWVKKSEQEDGRENPVKQALTDVIAEGSQNRFVFWVSRPVSPIPGKRRRGSKEYKEGGGALERNRVVRFVGSREQWLFAAWNARRYLREILQQTKSLDCECGEDCQKMREEEREQLRLPYEYAISQLTNALIWRYGTEVHEDHSLWERIIFPLQFPVIRYELLSFIGAVGSIGGVYLFPRIFEMAGGIPVDKKEWRMHGREYLEALQSYTSARINYFFRSRDPARGVPFPDSSVEPVEFKGPYLPITTIPLLETWLGHRIITTSWPVAPDNIAPFGLMKRLLIIAATSNSTWLFEIVQDWKKRVISLQKQQGDEITAHLLKEMECILDGIKPHGKHDDISGVKIEW